MVGAVLDQLEALDVTSNTVVFFSGDNGPDGTVRVFRWKFTLEGAICSHACSLEALAGE
jgi:arylsulfatase A-like enzyme